MAHDYRAALDTLGLALIDLPPAGTYRGVSIVGNTAYVAGHIGWHDGGPSVVGTLGDDLDITAGKIAARDAALTALGTLERPGRRTVTSMVNGSRVRTPRMSQESRASCGLSSRLWSRSPSITWVSNPMAGAMCCSSGFQPPPTCSVGRKREGPSTTK